MHGISEFSLDAEGVYGRMAEGFGFDGDREILVTRGLADWILHFYRAPSVEHLTQRRTSAIRGLPGAREEIVVLFANIIKEATLNGI